MKHYSDQFDQIEGLRSAVLTERCDASPSEYAIEIDVGSDGGMAYMEPETLMHKGGVLFYGKGTSGSGSNRGGDAVLGSTASDFRWLYDRQTLGAQLRELRLSPAAVKRDLQGAANEALSNWYNLEESSRVEAAGWSCDANGDPVDGTVLSVDASLAGQFSVGSSTSKGTVMSIGRALRLMKRSNPGTYMVPDYNAGVLRILKYEDLPELVLDTRVQHILEISGITPNYEDVPTGVAVVVSWKEKEGVMGMEVEYSKVLVWPEDLDIDATGVRVFKATAPNERAADDQAEFVMQQLRAWFEGASHVFCSGSVTLKMQDLAGSPLAHKLNIVGPGAIDTMGTPITSVEWDFLRQTVTLNLGGEIPEPKISTLPFGEPIPGSRSTTTGGAGSWPSTTREKSSTTEETTGGDTTYTEPGSVSSTTLEPWSTTEGPWPGSTTTESTTGSTATESTTAWASTTCGCGCAERWRELERRLEIINERLEILERGSGGSCECQCLAGGLMAQIQAAIDEAVGNVQVRASLTQLLEVTQTGNLMIDGEVNANSTGGTSSVDAHY